MIPWDLITSHNRLPCSTILHRELMLNAQESKSFYWKKLTGLSLGSLCSDLSLADVHSQDTYLFCNTLTCKILSIAECSIPVSSGKVKARNRVPWWNEACSKAVQDRKKALKILKKNPAENYLLNYRSLENQAKRVILTQKLQIGKNSLIQQLLIRKLLGIYGKKFTESKENHSPLYRYLNTKAKLPLPQGTRLNFWYSISNLSELSKAV
ncbi:hypothetical protein DPMN_067482 [Dreissena polymorpha]|uniref:Uncharacterized protein n=1 Tax=Dreissena polymorpha TaxID=45954 RepID=A0A9D3YVV3_DREPO|nr:hypothetical protein DPMN_067482 [Dreissena polymorpha]